MSYFSESIHSLAEFDKEVALRPSPNDSDCDSIFPRIFGHARNYSTHEFLPSVIDQSENLCVIVPPRLQK